MSKLTKAQLENQLAELKAVNEAQAHEIRRLDRAIGQAELDRDYQQERLITNVSPSVLPQVPELIRRALAEWSQVVAEPPGKNWERIDYYIRSRDCLGWTWEKQYTKNKQFAWCGAFAAYFWGPYLNFTARQKILPSCYRLYNNWVNTSRKVEPEEMLPGDIVVIFNSNRAKTGDHITICLEPPCNGTFKTLEGNAWGTLGNGERGEGVIQHERPMTQVAWVYRILASDLDE